MLPELDAKDVNKSTSGKVDTRTSIFQYPWLILGALAIFFHVGSQMISLATIIDYAGTMGLPLEGNIKARTRVAVSERVSWSKGLP